MAGVPQKLDWDKLLPGCKGGGVDDPPPELVIVSDAPSTSGTMYVALSSHDLEEKIKRVEERVKTDFVQKLPDKGEKLRLNLRQLLEERERRRNSGVVDITEPKKAASSQNHSVNDSRVHPPPKSNGCHTFADALSKLIETEADSGCGSAFKEELRCFGKDKNRIVKQNCPQMHRDRMETGIASRKAPFRHSSRFCNNTDKVDKNRHDGDHMGVSCSSFYSTTTRQSFSRNSEKRRLSPVRGSPNLSFSKSRKVQDVVLLDEEDMQTTPPTDQEDGSAKWKEVKIYYPSRDHPEAVEICPGDLKCLDPEAYISSPIMNYYILYLQKSAVVPLGKRKDDYHFFNTYLYKKLEETMSCKSSEKDAFFKKLRRWWKGVNIFQKAYIFLPIHRDLHWSLAIICIPAKEDESGPIVLHLDSLGLHTSKFIFDNIEGYLKQEWEFVKENDNAPRDLPMSDRIWRNLPRRIERRIITVPQQKNDYDCGLFVLYFIERFIEMAPERVRKKDLDMFGKKWFHPEEASALRRKLLELLTEELASARAPNVCAESPPCSSESSEDKNGKCDVDEVKSEVEEVKSESSEDENGKCDDEVKSDVEEVKCDDEEVCIVSSTP